MRNAIAKVYGPAPRGQVSVSDRMVAAARQRAEGMSIGELAAFYGVTRKTVSDWCIKVATAEVDARRMKGARDAGR